MSDYRRYPSEPAVWRHRFTYYCQARGELTEAWRLWARAEGAEIKGDYPPPSWRQAVERYNWKARCLDFLDEQQRGLSVQWERRILDWSESLYDAAEALRKKAMLIVQWPIERRTVSRDGQTVIVEPVGFKVADAARMIQIADMLVASANRAAKPADALRADKEDSDESYDAILNDLKRAFSAWTNDQTD